MLASRVLRAPEGRGLSFTKYLSVTARATRQALKEEARVKAETRSSNGLRYQEWKDGKAGEQTYFVKPDETAH